MHNKDEPPALCYVLTVTTNDEKGLKLVLAKPQIGKTENSGWCNNRKTSFKKVLQKL